MSYLAPGLNANAYYLDASTTSDITFVKTYSGNAWSESPPVIDFEWALLRETALERIADALEARTAYLSVVRRAATMSSFITLAGAGSRAISLALRRLRGDSAPLWLYFLERAMPDAVEDRRFDSIDSAARWWRRWGRTHGLI
jgi:hypothetical protein